MRTVAKIWKEEYIKTKESGRMGQYRHQINVTNYTKKQKQIKQMINDIPAYLRSFGVPDFARTSRSTRLIDISPNVSPDIIPANKTKSTIITICKKNCASQHSYSTAIYQLQKIFSFFYIQLLIYYQQPYFSDCYLHNKLTKLEATFFPFCYKITAPSIDSHLFQKLSSIKP